MAIDELIKALEKRAKAYKVLLEALEWKKTGGHPDHGDPDPLWSEAYDAILLLKCDLHRAIDLLKAYRKKDKEAKRLIITWES